MTDYIPQSTERAYELMQELEQYLKDQINVTVEKFIIAVRISAQADENPYGASDKSRVCLILGIEECLQDKKNRVKVLQAITGLPLSSQNHLTQVYQSVLIHELKNNLGWHDIISRIEQTVIETGTGRNPWEIYP